MAAIRIRVLMGKHPDDSGPSVAGCVDDLIWEVEGEIDTERRWARCKKEFGPLAAEMIWREVIVEVPEAEVMRYFDAPTIGGRVCADEGGAS